MTATDCVDEGKTERNEVPVENSTKANLTLEILVLIKESQQQHGLRHGDYQRYRSYCTRRLRRIRKSLHFCMTSGKRRFQNKKLTIDNLNDSKQLQLALVSAERAWSYAMQLRTEANTEPRKKFHTIARLRKATKYAEDLDQLCQSEKCDARTKLEAQAYSSWMQATLDFEMENWEEAIEHFQKARTIYEKLGTTMSAEGSVLYQQRVEEFLPNIRYCAYNIGDDTALDDLMQMRLTSTHTGDVASNIDTLISQTREKQAVTLSEVTWRGRTVPVKQEKVRLFLLNLKEVANNLSKAEDLDGKMSVYESLLMDCKDALQVLRDEIRLDPLSRPGNDSSKLTGLQYLHTYLAYERLTKTIDRTLLMITTLKENLMGSSNPSGTKAAKPQDLIRLYDVIIQNLSEILQLPGLDDDIELTKETEAKITAYKAYRCFYIALSYASLQKSKEAAALYERTQERISEALSAFQQLPSQAAYKDKQSNLKQLKQQVESKQYSVQASAILEKSDTSKEIKKPTVDVNKTLLERLDIYYEDPVLKKGTANFATFPPPFEPIPCKPLFFDLALNHVEFPSLEERMETRKTGPGKGITGFVKGWLWGGGKDS